MRRGSASRGSVLSATHTIRGGDYDGWPLRVRGGALEAQTGTPPRWRAVRGLLRDLTRAYAAGAGPWPWLLAQGVRRPSPSGASGTNTPRAERRRSSVELTLSDEARALLDARSEAHGVTRSALVEEMIRAAK